jgi:MFS family permease
VGMLIHFGLSALFGLIFTWLTESRVPELARSRATVVLAATGYGLLLWPLNLYLIAPFVGWEWFAQETEPVVQAAAHLCYGLLLGLYLDHRLVPRPVHVV